MKDASFTDWMAIGLMVVGYLFIVVKAGEWLVGVLINFCNRWIKRKNKQQLAIEDLLEAFPVKSDEAMIITTNCGYKIRITKEKE
jgi:formate-dependent nitrite reductase membrane component NrfD